jgi:hypothetical protein
MMKYSLNTVEPDIMAGFRSERVVGFTFEWLVGLVGIRTWSALPKNSAMETAD